MIEPRLVSRFWKISSGVVIAALLFGGPLSDVVPLLPATVPSANAAASDYPGISGTPAPEPCVPIVTPTGVSGAPGFGICTDYGQSQALSSKIKSKLDYQLTFAAYLGVLNMATYFAQTIAYDTATWMASGFKGQAPGIYTDPFGTYTRNLVLDSVGEFMGTFSENFTKGALGVDLCRPPNFPQLALEFALQLPSLELGTVQRPRPSCSWTSIVQNWEQAAASLDNADALRNISANFSTGGNDISFGIGAHLAFFDYVAEKREAGIAQRLLGSGYKDVTNFISGNIETPAQTVQRSIENSLIENPAAAQNEKTGSLISSAFELGWVQLGVVTASTFTNVLLSSLLQKVAKGLVKTTGGGSRGLPDLLNPNAAAPGSTASREIIASQFSDLKTPRITKADAQDLLTDLSACPTDARNKWNCAMDQSFATALRQGGGLTVRQAMDQGFLNPSWELIPSTRVKDNQDSTCASRAFCAANLRKLRLARVIPVGWELAADSPANQEGCIRSGSCVTLDEVIRRFDDCNAQGALDAQHPYCRLIDPNWVLTIFPAQCQTEGYGNQTLAGTSQRLQECQDTATCLQRDKNGNCTGGYGFCMAEQTFWQFDAPTCQEQFSTCRTFTPRGQNAQQVSYLRSTLDYGSCNANNVGCMWYATRRDPTGADSDTAWAATTTPAIGVAPLTADRIYFNKNAVPCDASNDGCSSLRRVVPGASALNVIQNGSFEQTTGTPATLLGWTARTGWTYTPPTVGAGTAAQDGSQALLAITGNTGSGTLSQDNVLGIRPLRQYTLSFSVRRNTATPPAGAAVYVSLRTRQGVQVASPGTITYFRSAGCTLPNTFGPSYATAGVLIPSTVTDEWSRFTCSFVTTPDAENGTVFVDPGLGATAGVLVDAVQLEETEIATPFIDGLNTSLATVNMKVPPLELGCTGNTATDHALCANYARVCRQNEAGCQGYRPVGDTGAPEVPAVLTNADVCPSECVGYAEYRKQPSTFDLTRSTDTRLDDPEDDTVAAFVPSTALSCSAQDVGCELFTNLDAAAQGGEAQTAFNYLRSCEKPGSDSQTYYTWEGSDTTGYQLKTWSLKRDTTASVPQGPRIIAKTGPDGVLKNPATCDETAYLQAIDADCRQFYDPQGNVFFRFESQTVLSSDECHEYRKDGSTRADCEKTGGAFNQQTSQCVYGADPSQSRQCAASFAGCRAYAGTQGRAQEEVFFEDFNGSAFNASATLGSGPAGSTIAASDESVLVGDKSLRVQRTGVSRTFYAGPVDLQPGALYELTFWAKGTIAGTSAPTVTVSASVPTSQTTVPVGSAAISMDWRTYRMGPFQVSENVPQDYLTFGMSAGDTWFFDKIRVERLQDITYVVKNSWNTPATCDRTPEGVPQAQAMLGCRAYTDRNKAQVNARQFTRLCREDVIGCTAYVNTQQTDSPYWQRVSKLGAGTGVQEYTDVPADRYDYYVEDKGKFCSSSAVSCRAFGKPNYTLNRLSLDPETPFTTVFLKNDPSAYGNTLCSEPELFCEAYAYGTDHESGTTYFRAPGAHACEYRTSVVVPDGTIPNFPTAGRTYDGWFRIGTDAPCYPDQLKSGSIFDLRLTGDPGFNAWAGSAAANYPTGQTYQGWAATCPATQAECTELRDVTDTSDPLRPLGRPYFVVNNNQVDQSSCDGQVDPGRGCVLFRDLSDTRLLYNTAATYEQYKTRAYQSVDPVSCDPSGHPACAAVGATTNDANLIVKVKPDRSCAQWLSCSTAETVYDPQSQQYKSICSSLALCNRAGTSEGAGIPFCANYINRDDPSQTLLSRYAVLDASTYASRPVGFGSLDYDGVTVPDHLQVLDSQLKPVGSMLSLDSAARSTFKTDYRLVVGVPVQDSRLGIRVGVIPGGQNQPLTYVTDYGAIPATSQQKQLLAGAGTLANFACAFRGGATRMAANDTNIAFGILTNKDGVLDANNNGRLDYTLNVLADDEAAICWVSLDQSRPPQLGVAGAPLVSDNLNMVNLVTRLTQTAQPKLDQTLAAGLPDAQCKAAPEADAPFGNEFVLEWDDTVTPPRPTRVSSGYAQMNFCEYGENCACSYKRVEYGGPSRFYEPLSTNVANAICLGGPRDGEPCALDAGIQGSSQPSGQVVATDAAGNPLTDANGNPMNVDLSTLFPAATGSGNASCGTGVCSPIKAVSLVRGAIGQCLEQDLARSIAGDPSRHECLLWSPNPVFVGPGDPYHWIPSAGFQPPQSSGRYYCTSPVRPAKTLVFRPTVQLAVNDATASVGEQVGFAQNKSKTYAGAISKFWYDDAVTSDGSCVGIANPFGDSCDGNDGGGSLDGTRADGTKMGAWCEQADDDQSPSANFGAVRLVTTGRGSNRSYAEYAVLMDWKQIGKVIAGYPVTAEDASVDLEAVRANSTEDVISGFTFSPDRNKLGCAYSEDWVANVGGIDYDDSGSWKPKDKTWQAGFQAEMARNGGLLDRRNARILTEDGSATGVPVKMDCNNPDNEGESQTGCFVKTWTLDYRADGQLKAQAFGPDIGRPSMDSLSRSPVYGKCDSDHSWFSIKAVFEDANAAENEKMAQDVNPDALTGPFQLVGFWVTTCAPADGPRYIYMHVNMTTADVCRELAETISKDSHQSAAFTDRNADSSGFTIPRSGFQWATTNIPFGASLATRDAGAEPLYMTGVKQAGVNPLHPPAFTFPGQTYFRPEEHPKSNWGMLSNVFAKIYRMYTYNARGVSRDDWACTNPASPNFGQWCPNLDNADATDQEKKNIAKQYCGYAAKCVQTGFSGESLLTQKVCNTFSGVNRGLDCTSDPDICHRGPVSVDVDGVLRPQYGSCDVRNVSNETWTQLSNKNWRCAVSACPTGASASNDLYSYDCSTCQTDIGCKRTTAILCGAFRCSSDSVRAESRVNDNPNYGLSFCTTPSDQSPECPLAIDPGAEACVDVDAATGIGRCESHPWSQCETDTDCSFEPRNFWGSGVANQTFAWADEFGKTVGNWTKPLPPGASSDYDGLLPNAKGSLYRYGVPSSLNASAYPGMQSLIDPDDSLLRTAFSPVYATADESTFFGTPIKTEGNSSYVSSEIGEKNAWDDLHLLRLYPGFSPMIVGYSTRTSSPNVNASSGALEWVDEGAGKLGYFRWRDASVGTCKFSLVPGTRGSAGTCLGGPTPGKTCILDSTCRSGSVPNANNLIAQYAACEPLALMFQDGGATGTHIGTCAGGVRSGSVCGADNDCLPQALRDMTAKNRKTALDAADDYCNPAAKDASGDYGKQTANEACWPSQDNATLAADPNFVSRQDDTTRDNNICTHPPGYWPSPSTCKDPNDEYCGLLGYDLGNTNTSVSDNQPLPTDVSAGLATPAFLNPGGTNVSDNPNDYNYIRYYNPIPPQVAAPDMRSCQGGTCRVSALGTIGVDGLNDGIVNGGAGSHVAALRFYAWASHEQMPLRRLVIDWGDGSQTELPDASLKNHKPYCQTPKECSLSPGLTCQSDTDCPPGGGTCQTYGSCVSDPNKRCSQDRECDTSAGNDGVCAPRTFFGSDGDACEEQYFEFRHSYACLPSSGSQLQACSSGRVCSSDPNHACTSDANCAAGDRCIPSAAPTSGCYDAGANACRFTPRIMLVDNWGWCTGECRSAVAQNGLLTDASFSGYPSFTGILHPNGGCFTSNDIKANNNPNQFISRSNINECNSANPIPINGTGYPLRPWVVFPGSVQVRSGEIR